MSLSSKHIQVRDFILRYQAEKGTRPVYKEIMAACGIGSTRTVHKIVRRLDEAEELRLEYGVPKAKAVSASS